MSRDNVDVACEEWAAIVRELYGLTEQRGFLGPLRCTLAARRDLHHGARTERPDQHWPEFPFANASEAARLVHRAVHRQMPAALAQVIVAAYVPLEPKSRTVRAELMGLSRRVFFDRLGRGKMWLEGRLAGD